MRLGRGYNRVAALEGHRLPIGGGEVLENGGHIRAKHLDVRSGCDDYLQIGINKLVADSVERKLHHIEYLLRRNVYFSETA